MYKISFKTLFTLAFLSLTFARAEREISPSAEPQEHVLINVNHIVDFIQSMKRSQDEMDKKIEALTKSDGERSVLDDKLSALAVQVSKIESLLPSKIDELLVKRLNELRNPDKRISPLLPSSSETQAEEPIKLDPTLFQIEQPFTPPPLFPMNQRSSRNIVYLDPFRGGGPLQATTPSSQSYSYFHHPPPASIMANNIDHNHHDSSTHKGNGNGNGKKKDKNNDFKSKLESFKQRILNVERSLQTVGKNTTVTRVYHSSQMEERVSQNEGEIQFLRNKQAELQRAIDTVLIHFTTIVRDVENVEERQEGCGCSNGTGAGGGKKIKVVNFDYEEDLRKVFVPPVETSTLTPSWTRPTEITTTTTSPPPTTFSTTHVWESHTPAVETQTDPEMSYYDEWDKRSSEEQFREQTSKDVSWVDHVSAEREEEEPEQFDFGTYAFLKPLPNDKKSGAQVMLRDEGAEDKSGQMVRRDLSFLAKILRNLTRKVEDQRQQIKNLSSQLIKVNVTHSLLLKTINHENLKRTIRPKDCSEVKLVRKISDNNSTNYNSSRERLEIFPKHNDHSVQVVCDMQTEGGGWTLIQRRGHPLLSTKQLERENFYRNWTDYQNGFGSVQGDFWIGLESLAALTKQRNQELRIELTNWEGETRFARYKNVQVEDASNFYRLWVNGYSGNAGDSFSRHSGMAFSTMDQDHDTDPHRNCAQMWKGAWWYFGCHESNLNGLYGKEGNNGGHEFGTGIVWFHWTGNYYSLKHVEIKIRNTFLQTRFMQ